MRPLGTTTLLRVPSTTAPSPGRGATAYRRRPLRVRSSARRVHGAALAHAFGTAYCTWMRKPLPPGVDCSCTSRGPGAVVTGAGDATVFTKTANGAGSL